MIRIILFLFLIGVVALGAAVIADQTGDVTLSWNAWRVDTSLPVLALALLVVVCASMLVWAIIRGFLRAPERLRKMSRERRQAKGRNAITQGLIAIGTGDHFAARRHADVAKRIAQHDPLAMLLHAQTAQLHGDSEGAQRAFHAMAERKDTRLLGLRDCSSRHSAATMPIRRCAGRGSLEDSAGVGLGIPCGAWLPLQQGRLGRRSEDLKTIWRRIDRSAPYKRQRGVLLTARALDLETSDRDKSRASAMEAVKLAPTLVPAATLAAKFLSENNQTRRAMQAIEAAWIAQPHPDLADA